MICQLFRIFAVQIIATICGHPHKSTEKQTNISQPVNNNDSILYTELQPGTKLNGGKYVIERKISTGGFGITYRAIQTALNRTVCIKEYFLSGYCVRNTGRMTVMPQDESNALFEKYRKAFVNEAQTLASLHHNSIVEVIDIFDENDTSYMVMPFIEGQSLQNIVDNNGPLDFSTAFNYMAQIADAIAYLHGRKILHRDIKPDNIMITNDFRAVLIDFGSAREFVNDKTQAQTSMLTHGYAPTEQYSKTSRKGNYTDIYALGATLYFVLTGKTPTDAAARITEPLPEPREIVPSIPENANRTILKAMQMQAKDRHQTIEEFMADLNGTAPSAPISNSTTIAPDAGPIDGNGTGNGKKKRPLLTILIILAVLLVLGGVGAFIYYNNFSSGSKKEKKAKDKTLNAPKYYIIAPSLNLRSSPDFDATDNKIVLKPYGTELLAYDSVPGQYFRCKFAPRDASGKIVEDECIDCYVAYQYLFPKADYYLMNSIFGNEEARDMLGESRYKIALLNYFKEHHYRGNLTDSEIDEYGINPSYKNAERWQVFCKDKKDKLNNVYRSRKYNTYSKHLDAAIIIENLDTHSRKLLYFVFDDDETPRLLFEQPVYQSGFMREKTMRLEYDYYDSRYYVTVDFDY